MTKNTFIFLCLFFNSSAVIAQDVCQTIAGAIIVANDGTYLGKIASEYDSESVLNEYGTYGSEYSSKSIWNEYSVYGGKFSAQSPFNQYTSTPPLLIKNGQAIARLTINQYLRGALNPYVIKSCTFY